MLSSATSRYTMKHLRPQSRRTIHSPDVVEPSAQEVLSQDWLWLNETKKLRLRDCWGVAMVAVLVQGLRPRRIWAVLACSGGLNECCCWAGALPDTALWQWSRLRDLGCPNSGWGDASCWFGPHLRFSWDLSGGDHPQQGRHDHYRCREQRPPGRLPTRCLGWG